MSELKYLELLSKNFRNIAETSTEIINLEAILNLPKGTEHFLSDIHGEYEAFTHVLRNGSGSIRQKIEDIFGETLDEAVEWCRQRGIEFWAVNRDYPEETVENNNHYSRKLKVDLFIDDRNVGGLPDWGQIYRMIHDRISLYHLLKEQFAQRLPQHSYKKKHWWQF